MCIDYGRSDDTLKSVITSRSQGRPNPRDVRPYVVHGHSPWTTLDAMIVCKIPVVGRIVFHGYYLSDFNMPLSFSFYILVYIEYVNWRSQHEFVS